MSNNRPKPNAAVLLFYAMMFASYVLAAPPFHTWYCNHWQLKEGPAIAFGLGLVLVGSVPMVLLFAALFEFVDTTDKDDSFSDI